MLAKKRRQLSWHGMVGALWAGLQLLLCLVELLLCLVVLVCLVELLVVRALLAVACG